MQTQPTKEKKQLKPTQTQQIKIQNKGRNDQCDFSLMEVDITQMHFS